jgi:hypothetical protein
VEEVLRAMNTLITDGVIAAYAIGGAVGASFYISAVNTEDIDAFVYLPRNPSGLLDLSLIYTALTRLGGVTEREYIRFGDWPLQILPDANELIYDAILRATATNFGDVPTRVFTAEHLCCIALQTGRDKDILRFKTFLREGKVGIDALHALAARFGLASKLTSLEDEFHG